MGSNTDNNDWIHPKCIIVPPNNNSHNKSSAYKTSCFNHYAILDSGATDHYLHQNPNTTHSSQAGYTPITVTLPNGNTLTSTQKFTLPIRDIKEQEINGHIVPKLNKSLISIGKICDANYTAVFTNKDVRISKAPIKYQTMK